MNQKVEKITRERKGLIVTGIIFLIITFIFLSLFAYCLLDSLMSEGLDKGIGLVIALVYLLIPGAILSFISLIINFIVLKRAESKRIKSIPFILSLSMLILFIAGFVIILLQ